MSTLQIKRVYETPSPEDGMRILVERLWPRGLTREKAAIDLWIKDIAPSAELRKWFAHDPAKWEAFRKKYRNELKHNPAAVETLRQHLRRGTVTLVYAAHDQRHNGTLVLKNFLELP
jgi:uncharacterized protein YeaO (DUF488 family)